MEGAAEIDSGYQEDLTRPAKIFRSFVLPRPEDKKYVNLVFDVSNGSHNIFNKCAVKRMEDGYFIFASSDNVLD